jgi:hypothetical protein
MNWGATKQSLTGLTLGALAFALVILGTRPPGPGLYGDSAGYLGAAESLVHSGTLRVPFAPYVSPDSTAPLAQWPPGFPVAIAAPMVAGFPAMTSARIVVAASAAITVALTVWLLGFIWGALAAIVLGLTASVVAVHLDVLSEPMFIAVTVATLVAMVTWPRRPLVYGLGGAVSLLVRYLGLAVVAACALWAAIQPAPTLGVRVRRAILGALPGGIVYVAWAAVVRAGGGTVRRLHVDHFPIQSLRQFVGATLAWLGPDTVGNIPRVARVGLKAVLLLAVLWLLARAWRRRIVAASVLLAVACGALLLTAQLLQGNVEFSDRTFSPVHALLDIGVIAAFAVWWRGTRSSRQHAVGVAAIVAWAVVATGAVSALVKEARNEGFYHAKVDAVHAPLWRWVRDSARTRRAALYSNDVADVYFATHRPARMMPWVVDADTARALAAALGRQPALIIWANGYTESVIFPELRPVAATPERLEALLPLRRVAVFPEGLVWEYGH